MNRIAATLALGLAACTSSSTQDSAGTGMDDVDAAPAEPVRRTALDLLLVVDDTELMPEPQTLLAEALPGLIRQLFDGDESFESVHLGVVSTDMGVHVQTIPGCPSHTAADGRLLLDGAVVPTVDVQKFHALSSPGDLEADTFRGMVELGENGCPIESTLEAPLKALASEGLDVMFKGGEPGHGDGYNQGFLREDSVVGVLILTTEDDCSSPESSADLQEQTMGPYQHLPITSRCAALPELLHPVDRYEDGLRGIVGDPDRLVFAAITGVPTALSGAPTAEILQNPSMTPVVDGWSVEDVCESSWGGADPAARVVDLADRLSGLAWSICEEDYAPALEGFGKALLSRR